MFELVRGSFLARILFPDIAVPRVRSSPMNRWIVSLTLSTLLIALAPLAAAHGGEFTAEGVTEATNPLRITIVREPDPDPNATAPLGFFPAVFSVTLTDATGAVVEQELAFPGFDNFDGHGTTVPWNYQFSSRADITAVHFHGGGDAVRGNVFSFSGHFEGAAGVHHGFNAVAVVA
jgi:hypothetical protein